MVGKTALASIIVLLTLVGVLGAYIRFGQTTMPGNPQTTSSSIPNNTSASCVGTCTTLEAIISGQFQTALDKSGTGGTSVTVSGLEVLYVEPESDGDWHVAVTDGRVPVFITEIIPRDQGTEGQPPTGAIIDETGTPFCDTFHECEAWHGNTCWEIHPVTAWHLSSASGVLTTTSVPLPFTVNISIAHNPIIVGANQTITISLRDSDGPAPGLNVDVQVTYASGYVKYFHCTTLADGTCSASWTIGTNSNPGTFMVDATVDGQMFSSSFSVTSA